MNYHNNDMPVAKSVGRKFRNDLIFIATLLLVLILAGAALFIFREEGTAVTITVDGILYGTYPLSQPLTLEIQTGENNEQINRLVIKDGKAVVTDAITSKIDGEIIFNLLTISEPKLLICDEPTTALDVTIQEGILALLKKINREKGTGILFISHNLHVVRKLCTRVAVMCRGELIEEGPVDEVFLNPQQDYTKRLIAAIPTRRKRG